MSSAKGPVLLALTANLAIAAAKFLAALFSGSHAMLAEAYHSLSDTLNQVFLLVGLRRSRRPADETHPFGSGKSAYFWSFVVAVFIFGIAGVLSVLEGIDGLRHPHTPDPAAVPWAWGTLAFAAVFEGIALRTAVKGVRSTAQGRSLRQAVARSKDAALLTIIFEDSLALTGLTLAAAGLGLSLWTGDGRYDAAASLLIGILLMAFALVLANRNRRLLIGEALLPEQADAVREAVRADPAVQEVVSIKTMHLRADEVIAAIEVQFVAGLTTDAIVQAVDRIEAAVRGAVPLQMHVYVEAEQPEASAP